MRGDVRTNFFMNDGTIWLQSFFKVNDSIQWFIIHLNISERVFSDVTTLRQYHHHRLTCKLDFVLPKWNLRFFIEDNILNRRWRDEERTRLPVIPQIVRSVNGNHTL